VFKKKPKDARQKDKYENDLKKICWLFFYLQLV